MSATVAERPPRLFDDPPEKLGPPGAPRPVETSGGGRLTLGRKLDRVWEGLRAGGVVECPLCLGHMVLPAAGGNAQCADCGSSLH